MSLLSILRGRIERTEVTSEELDARIEYETFLKRHEEWVSAMNDAVAQAKKTALMPKSAIAPTTQVVDPYAWKKELPLSDQEHQNELYRQAVLQEPGRVEVLERAWERGWKFVPGQLDDEGNPLPGQLPRPTMRSVRS